ncbi:MAG TPA: sugar ABC transporter permease [Acetobacteraceae bacterium]|nr:sugar ABC transporter permease [Acetobacteraceae bacterium]
MPPAPAAAARTGRSGPAPRTASEVSFTPYGLILPSFLLAAFIIAYPLVQLGNLSVHDVTRFGFVRGFVGWANVAHVLADPLFQSSLWRTLIWTAGVVGGTVALSVPVALILNGDFIGRGAARALIMLPWSVSLTMTAIVWRWALNGESGLLNLTLQELGIIRQPIVWLASAATAFPMEIAIGILVSIPFTVTIFLGGLSSIPHDIYEAASVDGASHTQQFRTLTLPLMRPYINIAIVLNIIYVFNSFPIIWVLTQGGPANSTDILVTYLYKLAFVFGRMGDAAAMSLVMFAILLAFTLVYLRLILRSGGDEAA